MLKYLLAATVLFVALWLGLRGGGGAQHDGASDNSDATLALARELSALARDGAKLATSTRVALGYNANLDGVSNATAVLGRFLRQSLTTAQLSDRAAARDHASIASERELAECFAHFFAAGAAAERFVERALFDRLVDVVQSDASTRLSPGGNAALMANRVATLGGVALLGGPVGAALRPLLHSGVSTVAKVAAAGSVDEYHLIFEYARGDVWLDGAVATRGNRFILHSDRSNGRVDGLELFHRALRAFQPSRVVIAGLHLLQEQTATFRSQRVDDVRAQLCAVPHSVALHFEFASIGERAFVRELAHKLLADVDSIGMNEQELGDLHLALDGSVDVARAVARGDRRASLRAIGHLFRAADELATRERQCAARRLTRVHFHYFSYHIVALRGARWGDGDVGAGAGSWAATTQACAFASAELAAFNASAVEARTDVVAPSIERNTLRGALGVDALVDANFTLVPVLVCRRPLRTVGLGDAISASALVSQSWSPDI